MKRFLAFAAGLMLSVSLGSSASLTGAPQFGIGQQRGQNRDRVCVYQDIQYNGWEQCYNMGDEIATFQRRNNAISSIRVYGRARVVVFEDTEFRGRSAEFTQDVPDLGLRSMAGSRSWSDHIQSMRVGSDVEVRDNRRDEPVRNDPFRNDSRINDGICVYDRPDYRGREQCWAMGTDIGDLARSGNWSDKISSIRVMGRAVVVGYRDIQYRGESVIFDRDVSDLRQVTAANSQNWDRQISSLAIENDRGGRGRGRGRN